MHEIAFPNSPDSVPAARRSIVAALAGAPRDVIDVVAVMVSELATNAIRHAGTGFVLGIDRTDDALRVEVTDPGVGEPAMRSPEPWEPTGRGLRIVQEFSDDWGVAPSPGRSGKTVWFTISLSVRPGESRQVG
jgi:anti-sigma regulatory factor (Ser/Thr protein kinase)